MVSRMPSAMAARIGESARSAMAAPIRSKSILAAAWKRLPVRDAVICAGFMSPGSGLADGDTLTLRMISTQPPPRQSPGASVTGSRTSPSTRSSYRILSTSTLTKSTGITQPKVASSVGRHADDVAVETSEPPLVEARRCRHIGPGHVERSRADAVGHGFCEHVHPVGPSVEVYIRANGVAKTRQRLKGEDLRHRIHRGGQQPKSPVLAPTSSTTRARLANSRNGPTVSGS